MTIRGTGGLIVHNVRLANPLDPAARELKKLTSKRKKTDEDYEEIARMEHAAGLYFDPDVGPYIPGENIWRCLYDAARKTRNGPKVKEGLLITSDLNPIAYHGPRDITGLWADANFRIVRMVQVETRRVLRCRPIFRQWQTDAIGIIDTSVLDLAELETFVEKAGQLIGLGNWRPRYGRFTAEVEEI
jgi:hypothetical protein